MPTPRIATIDARQLKLCLVSHRSPTLKSRWAVMSAHVHTQQCRPWGSPYRITARSMLGPMNRGDWHRVLEREASRGAASVRATFRIGIRQLRGECMNHLQRFEGAAS